MAFPIIVTERLCLRRWIDSDSQTFIEMNKDADVMEYFPKHLTDSESMESIDRINFSFDNNGLGLFAVENKSTKEFIGFTGFAIPKFNTFFTPCVEIGWRFQKKSWGQGFATEAAKACLKYGFEILGFEKIVSFTSSINKKSEQVMQRIGMSHIGEFNHPEIDINDPLCQHVLYQINKSETL
jgi:RimJ/RimL family protein N-acetyltransferase